MIRDMFDGTEREPLMIEVREEEAPKPVDPNQHELPLTHQSVMCEGVTHVSSNCRV